MKEILKDIIKHYKWRILIEIIFIVISIILIMYPSKLLGEIIDLMLENTQQSKDLILQLVIKILAASVGLLLARIVWKKREILLESQLVKEISDKLFTKLLKSQIEGLNKVKNGEIMTYFVSDVKSVSRIFNKLFSTLPRTISYLVIVIINMSSISNWKLTIFAMLPILITVIVVIMVRNRLGESYKAAQQSYTELSEYVQESTDSIRTTKAFVGEDKQLETFIQKNQKLKSSNLRVSKNYNLLDISISFGFGLAYSITLLYGSKLALDGEITVGNLVAFNSYLAFLENPVSWIPWMLSKYKKFKISYGRLQKMFDIPEEKIEIFREKKYKALDGNIEIKNLNFKYPGCLENVLENIDINIKNGETIGIIGVIGSGKTTLMNLLLKLYDVERGKIFIDGKDINDIPTEKIRKHICYITQDNFLFSATLKENINLFKDEFKKEQIEQSTKNAMIYDEISDMTDGINTVIGEKGIDLSGGQKQRVVISRAFLNNSDIVIFDDTFSALDNRTEQHLLKNIKELTKNKTCIIVSNRVSDIKHCNKIIVLEQGKIVENGTHNELIKKQKIYYGFYKNQAHNVKNEILE